MRKKILESLNESIEAVRQLQEMKNLKFIEESASAIAACFRSGNKLLIAGNGGSLCDASHFAEEFTGQFRKFREALPAISLSDAGHLSCVANDFGYPKVFSRGVEAYGKKGDVFIGLSTSGQSENIYLAFEAAKKRGLATIAFLGKGGGKTKGKADLELMIDYFSTSDRIQEAHKVAIHLIVELVEEILFYGPGAETKEILEELNALEVR